MKQTMKDLAIYLLELGNECTYEEAYAMIDTTYQRFQKDLSLFLKMVYQHDTGSELKLNKLSKDSFDRLLESLKEISRQVPLKQIVDLIKKNNPCILYDFTLYKPGSWDLDNAILFYESIRDTLYEVFNSETSKQEDLDKANKSHKRMERIYNALRQELYTDIICNREYEEVIEKDLNKIMERLNKLREDEKTEKDRHKLAEIGFLIEELTDRAISICDPENNKILKQKLEEDLEEREKKHEERRKEKMRKKRKSHSAVLLSQSAPKE